MGEALEASELLFGGLGAARVGRGRLAGSGIASRGAVWW